MREFLPIPAEVEIVGTYFPPLLLAALLGIVSMVVTVKLLTRYGLSGYFIFPNLVMLSMVIIYTLIIGTFLIPT